MKDLTGKVAVVTGAASGIGFGMVESFLDAGMKVVLSDVEEASLARATATLRDRGADVREVVADVSKPEQVTTLAAETLRAYGAVHVLCNNAGVGVISGPMWTSSLEDWSWVLGVNLMGVVHGIRTFLPIMIEQGTEAHVVNTASVAGLTSGDASIYSITKHAVVALSEGLFIELARTGLKPKVSVLCPGFVNTNIVEAARNRPAELPPSPSQPQGPVADAVHEWFKAQVQAGLPPRRVGDTVVEAIREERFYILTHPELNPMIEHRMKNILEGRPPVPLPPPGIESLLQKLAAMGIQTS